MGRGVERCRHAGGRWTIVNDVAGFIAPEVFTAPDQLERACLENARQHDFRIDEFIGATDAWQAAGSTS